MFFKYLFVQYQRVVLFIFQQKVPYEKKASREQMGMMLVMSQIISDFYNLFIEYHSFFTWIRGKICVSDAYILAFIFTQCLLLFIFYLINLFSFWYLYLLVNKIKLNNNNIQFFFINAFALVDTTYIWAPKAGSCSCFLSSIIFVFLFILHDFILSLWVFVGRSKLFFPIISLVWESRLDFFSNYLDLSFLSSWRISIFMES